MYIPNRAAILLANITNPNSVTSGIARYTAQATTINPPKSALTIKDSLMARTVLDRLVARHAAL